MVVSRGWGLIAGAGVTELRGVKLRVRTTIHTMKLSPQNSFGESYSWSIVRLRALRELNALQALPAIPFLKTKSQMGQRKNRSSEESHKKTTRLL